MLRLLKSVVWGILAHFRSVKKCTFYFPESKIENTQKVTTPNETFKKN